MRQVVKEREEKIETLNKSFDEKDKLLQELESRFVGLRNSDQLVTSPKIPTQRLVRRPGEYRD